LPQHARQRYFQRPIKTLAASGIKGFENPERGRENRPISPQRRLRRGQCRSVSFLISNPAAGGSAEITYADSVSSAERRALSIRLHSNYSRRNSPTNSTFGKTLVFGLIGN
jgi:hypothetical protein